MRDWIALLAAGLALTLAEAASAQGLNAKDLLPEVENCTLTLTGQPPDLDPEADAMVIKVGQASLGGGVTAHLFYYAPGKDGQRSTFGLILDATPEVVSNALPHYARTVAANGYRRELTSFGDPDGTSDGQGKALLVCRAQPA